MHRDSFEISRLNLALNQLSTFIQHDKPCLNLYRTRSIFTNNSPNYFRETGLPPLLLSLLLFPPNIPPAAPALQEFALQFWDNRKLVNALAIVAIIGLLNESKGYGGQDSYVFTRCLIKIALASNAPTNLKTQALHLLPANLNFHLSDLIITPYMPVPETNGEEWDRLEAASALDALVELALNREYNGQESARRLMTGLELRTAAVGVFKNFVRKEEIKYAIISAMDVPEGAGSLRQHLLQALSMSPETSGPLDHVLVSSAHFASLFFSHLLRSSPHCKTLTVYKTPTSNPNTTLCSRLRPLFRPRRRSSSGTHACEDDDPPQTLLQILAEHLSLAFFQTWNRENGID
ncbi:hypothetical protein BT96DRAFT_1010322 [Gymnopus androsaceus JB14]|uniref:Uncharacterized protein n=1 Tax=Gymnopus androsaceus JB14 TaxID=1447944 RepID=A0A6A4GAW0_9AGAR|nr:hypothetical protein BT96DRAFT_1010322 [Gymnopus androsaceus JB14]